MFSLMTCLLTLFSLFVTTVFSRKPQLVEGGSHDNSADCQCYLTSGPSPGYFQYYRFFDFRDVPSTDGDDDSFLDPPAVVTSSEDQGTEPITSTYFNTTAWNLNWSIQSGNLVDSEGTYDQVNSPANIYISRNESDPDRSTYLTLRTTRNSDFQSTAEVDSNQKNLLHSSIRARLRVIPDSLLAQGEDGDNASNDDDNSTHPVAPGAVVGFFTFESNTEESDIEILTTDPIDRLRYSNQPDYDPKTGNTVPGASTEYLIEDDRLWTDWIVHRLDWFPGVSQWWIDNDLVMNKTIHVPRKPSGMIVNLWSDGGEWSGNMSVGDQVVVGIEWIEMVFNISGGVDGPGHYRHDSRRGIIDGLLDGLAGKKSKHCEVACWVDAPYIDEPGQPVVAFNNTQTNVGGDSSRPMTLTLMVSSMMGLGMAFVLF